MNPKFEIFVVPETLKMIIDDKIEKKNYLNKIKKTYHNSIFVCISYMLNNSMP